MTLLSLVAMVERDCSIMPPNGVCGLEKPSELLLGQLIAVANVSFKKDLGALPEELFATAVAHLRTILDLPG